MQWCGLFVYGSQRLVWRPPDCLKQRIWQAAKQPRAATLPMSSPIRRFLSVAPLRVYGFFSDSHCEQCRNNIEGQIVWRNYFDSDREIIKAKLNYFAIRSGAI